MPLPTVLSPSLAAEYPLLQDGDLGATVAASSLHESLPLTAHWERSSAEVAHILVLWRSETLIALARDGRLRDVVAALRAAVQPLSDGRFTLGVLGSASSPLEQTIAHV